MDRTDLNPEASAPAQRNVDPRAASRHYYSAPKVTLFGRIRDLTASGSIGAQETGLAECHNAPNKVHC